jgi:hypothetical protein
MEENVEGAKKLLEILKGRFLNNMQRHATLEWEKVEARLITQPQKIRALLQMEKSGGEPDVIGLSNQGEYIFCDCSPETPKDRTSLCYDQEALDSRKDNKPKSSAVKTAEEIGANLLTEEEYFLLQSKGDFDLKTSSWLKTPSEMRKLGGALFGDKRFGRTFVYHNGASSYFAARGFRLILYV